MDETRIQSLTSQLESISGTTKYKEYQQAVMQTDGPNSVFIISPTSRAAGVSTMSRPTAIGDIVYMDGGTQAIVTGQNADGTFRARPTTLKENSTIAGFANGVQSASYISGFVTSLAQAAASAATTPRTGGVSAVPVKTPKATNPEKFSSNKTFNDHFNRHGTEVGATTKEEYLSIGQDVVKNGTRVTYSYGNDGGYRYGYVQPFGNTKNGNTKFIFVGTNDDGYITTIHVKSGKDFWKTINNDPQNKTIYPSGGNK